MVDASPGRGGRIVVYGDFKGVTADDSTRFTYLNARGEPIASKVDTVIIEMS
jgi:hypothetical protein